MVRFRRLAAGTAALTGLLMLLGVYTAAAGAGLTCAQRWPLCDGAVFGLFPADWPSFVEWFHRLVAMVTGVAVLWTTVRAWRSGHPRRVRLALAGALAVLPSQIALGALTVTTYEWLILLAHFSTATLILALLSLAAAWTYGATDPPARSRERSRRATYLAAGLFPGVLALSPRLFVLYTPTVQVAYYALGIGALGALLAATVWASDPVRRVATGSATAIVAALLVIGRQNYGDTVQIASLSTTLLAFLLAAFAAYRARAAPPARPDRGTLADGD
jgi:cytochrome c oxidase assembly protein subunit 15